MKPEFTYLLVVRQGAKRIAIAGTNSGGCLAGSETVFNFHGLKGDATWGEVLEKQKNYAGRSPDFRAVELSQTEQDIHWFRLALDYSARNGRSESSEGAWQAHVAKRAS